jgi:hypothetical protein
MPFQLVFVSDEASGQRLIFTTNGGKLEGPFAIETPVINSAATGDIAFTTSSHQNLTAELTGCSNEIFLSKFNLYFYFLFYSSSKLYTNGSYRHSKY